MSVMEPIEIISKNCTRCKNNKPLEQFCKDNRNSSGYSARCLACHRKVCHKYFVRGMNIILNYKSKPCMDCKKNYPPECMEFDHIRNDKLHNVTHMKNMSIDKIIQEIEKCELVCSVCHRLRTDDRSKPTTNERLLTHRAMIAQFKSKPCIDCANTFPPLVMDLDHVRGIKINNISDMGNYSRAKVLEELEKCEVVCANCHRVRTKKRIIS